MIQFSEKQPKDNKVTGLFLYDAKEIDLQTLDYFLPNH